MTILSQTLRSIAYTIVRFRPCVKYPWQVNDPVCAPDLSQVRYPSQVSDLSRVRCPSTCKGEFHPISRRIIPPLRREPPPQNRGFFHFPVILPVRKTIGPPIASICALFILRRRKSNRSPYSPIKSPHCTVFRELRTFGQVRSGFPVWLSVGE